MDNPVVDVIREYSVTYNDYVAKATIIEDNIESKAEEYLAAFAPVVTEEESERLGSIFEASNAILDELFEILGEFSDIFDDFNDIIVLPNM